jgi:hypothetical protein
MSQVYEKNDATISASGDVPVVAAHPVVVDSHHLGRMGVWFAGELAPLLGD